MSEFISLVLTAAVCASIATVGDAALGEDRNEDYVLWYDEPAAE